MILRLVLKQLKDLDPSRRCFRMIGGVLVERTIAEVRPAVEKNLNGVSVIHPMHAVGMATYNVHSPCQMSIYI